MIKYFIDLNRFSFCLLKMAIILAFFTVSAVYLPIHVSYHHNEQEKTHDCSMCFNKDHFSFYPLIHIDIFDVLLFQILFANITHKNPLFKHIFSTKARAPPSYLNLNI